MDDTPTIEAFGCTFEVTARGFDDRMAALARGLIEIDRVLSALGPQRVKAIHKAGLAADNDIDGMGTTNELMALEKAGMKAAGSPTDAVIWLRAIDKSN
jgi:hypothetical protein